MAKILVVDDSIFQRKIVCGILEKAGHQIEVASNGKEALEKVDQHADLNLVVSDLNMPVMSGVDFLKEMKNLNNSLPVVILTANIQEPVVNKCYELGALKVMHKPPKEDLLVQIINEVKCA